MSGQNVAGARDFRNALGSFPTGVTIVTTTDAHGAPLGVTASSFNSVSIDPPLVLWSLAKSSRSREAFCASGHFAIHVLAADQMELSNRFARSGGEKFDAVDWRAGELGSPVLDHYAALFECRTMHQYEGGDHVILVGEVVAFDRREETPLVFHGGRYAETRSRASGAQASDQDASAGAGRRVVDGEHGAFEDEFLSSLLARAYFQMSRVARAEMAALDLDEGDFLVLSLLSMHSPATAQDIAARLAHTGLAPDAAGLATLEAKGLLRRGGAGYELTAKGRTDHIDVLSIAKAYENDLLARLDRDEVEDTRRLLRKIVALT